VQEFQEVLYKCQSWRTRDEQKERKGRIKCGTETERWTRRKSDYWGNRLHLEDKEMKRQKESDTGGSEN